MSDQAVRADTGTTVATDVMSKERDQILAALKQTVGSEGIPIPALLLIVASYAVTFVSAVSSIHLRPGRNGVYSLCWAEAGSKDWMGNDSTTKKIYRISPDGIVYAPLRWLWVDGLDLFTYHTAPCVVAPVFRSHEGGVWIGQSQQFRY